MSEPRTLFLARGETMPNNRLPVLIYRRVLEGAARGFDALFRANGWGGTWRNGVYDYDHFHSNAHEVLGVDSGRATIQLGGETGEAVEVEAGDVLVLPAGTGHRRIEKSADFSVSGAYPPGQEHSDIQRSSSLEAELRISKVALPPSDPVTGKDGALMRLWR